MWPIGSHTFLLTKNDAFREKFFFQFVSAETFSPNFVFLLSCLSRRLPLQFKVAKNRFVRDRRKSRCHAENKTAES